MKTVELDPYIEEIRLLLQSNDTTELIIGIAGATGRRPTEIVSLGKFIEQDHPYLLRFAGQQKQTAVAAYDILTLLPAEQVLVAINQLRKQPEMIAIAGCDAEDSAVKRINAQVSRATHRLLGKTGLVPILAGSKTVSIQRLRGLYGAIAIHYFCPEHKWEYLFLQHYLGHVIDGAIPPNAKAADYSFQYVLTRNGTSLTARGVKIPSVGLLPVMQPDAEAAQASNPLPPNSGQERPMPEALGETLPAAGSTAAEPAIDQSTTRKATARNQSAVGKSTARNPSAASKPATRKATARNPSAASKTTTANSKATEGKATKTPKSTASKRAPTGKAPTTADSKMTGGKAAGKATGGKATKTQSAAHKATAADNGATSGKKATTGKATAASNGATVTQSMAIDNSAASSKQAPERKATAGKKAAGKSTMGKATVGKSATGKPTAATPAPEQATDQPAPAQPISATEIQDNTMMNQALVETLQRIAEQQSNTIEMQAKAITDLNERIRQLEQVDTSGKVDSQATDRQMQVLQAQVASGRATQQHLEERVNTYRAKWLQTLDNLNQIRQAMHLPPLVAEDEAPRELPETPELSAAEPKPASSTRPDLPEPQTNNGAKAVPDNTQVKRVTGQYEESPYSRSERIWRLTQRWNREHPEQAILLNQSILNTRGIHRKAAISFLADYSSEIAQESDRIGVTPRSRRTFNRGKTDAFAEFLEQHGE